MPDRRTHRGPHPEDVALFAAKRHADLRAAMTDYAYLLSRGYAETSALALVGNRHRLTDRQRLAIRRSCCSDEALAGRAAKRISISECRGGSISIDGYNLLITIESALSGGVVLVGRDGCCRDLASVHGSYRKVSETLPALQLIADSLASAGVAQVDWYFDRPVSNSGRLRALIADAVDFGGVVWRVHLVDRPDPLLAKCETPVATSDAWILDQCRAWVGLAAEIILAHSPEAWIMDMWYRLEGP